MVSLSVSAQEDPGQIFLIAEQPVLQTTQMQMRRPEHTGLL
jgi:hypothetical protein